MLTWLLEECFLWGVSLLFFNPGLFWVGWNHVFLSSSWLLIFIGVLWGVFKISTPRSHLGTIPVESLGVGFGIDGFVQIARVIPTCGWGWESLGHDSTFQTFMNHWRFCWNVDSDSVGCSGTWEATCLTSSQVVLLVLDHTLCSKTWKSQPSGSAVRSYTSMRNSGCRHPSGKPLCLPSSVEWDWKVWVPSSG